MIHRTIQKLKELPEAQLDHQLLAVGKHRLLAEVGRRQEERAVSDFSMNDRVRLASLRFTRRMIPAYSKVIAGALVLFLMVSTGFIAQAAIPGDVLWPVKISLEKAEVALTVNPASESRVHLRHVDNRLRELAVLQAKPSARLNTENISQLVRRLEKDITAAGQSLKIAHSEPNAKANVIIELAKDLSDKAIETAKTLQTASAVVNLEIQSEASEATELTATSTEPSSEATASSTEASVLPVEPEKELADVITEVALVNEYISYRALSALIETVERQGGNRSEVKGLIRERIDEQQSQYEAIEGSVALITSDFLLHKNQIKVSLQEANKSLIEANDFWVLDNLTASLRKLTESKESISKAARYLREVVEGGGLLEVQPVVPVILLAPLDPVVSMQAIPSGSFEALGSE